MKRYFTPLRLPVILLLSIFTASCATLTSDIDIETYTDPDVDLGQYKTYVIDDNAQIEFDPIGQWEQPTLDTDAEVRIAVDRELRAHGLRKVNEDPDLIVACAAGVDPNSLGLNYSPEHDEEILDEVPKSSLLVALVDTDSGYLVWLGYAVGEVQQKQSIEDIRTRIHYAVSEIFKSYD